MRQLTHTFYGVFFQLVSLIEFFKIANKYGYLIINDSFSVDTYLWAPKFNI